MCFDPDAAPWRKINSTHGLAKLVSFSEQPCSVPDDLIAGVKEQCDSDGIIRAPEQVRIGEIAQMLNGAFTDFITKIKHIDKEQRIWMLIDIVGQKISLHARHDHLKVRRL